MDDLARKGLLRHKSLAICTISLLASLLVWGLWFLAPSLLTTWENTTYDARLRWRGPAQASEHLVIIGRDRESENRFGSSIWDRSKFARDYRAGDRRGIGRCPRVISSPIQIPYAEKHREAEGLREQFARWCVQRGDPEAAQCLEVDRERMVTFYGFPKAHWQHLRTTNPSNPHLRRHGCARMPPSGSRKWRMPPR